MAEVKRTWRGDELVARSKRASGRAIIGMAEGVSREMTLKAHSISGDLRRSVHAARPDTMGGVKATQQTSRTGPSEWQIEVGSWLPYSCVENNRGGTHRFADIGWELARPTFDGKLKRAWQEEGLQ